MGEAETWAFIQRKIRPRPRLSPLEFGTQHRVYSKESRSSRWDPAETPWCERILWALSDDSPYRRIVAPKGTQLGFTEMGLIWIGQGCVEGRSALAILPTESTAKKVVRQKWRPFVRSTPALREIFTGRSADTTLHFSAPQVDVMFAGSNSATNFATVTVPRVMGDEIDRWSDEIADEGDPVELLENRFADYGFLGKLYIPCSPTLTTGVVWRLYLESDQQVFKTPCPNCHVRQSWLWDNMVCVVPGDSSTAALKCLFCEYVGREHEWKGCWTPDGWEATVEQPVRCDTIGFHLSSLYGRLGGRTWADLMESYLAAMRSGREGQLQPFFNTRLALPWEVSEDSIDGDELRQRLEGDLEQGIVPEDGLLLTVGVDYQKTWLEAWVWAWNRRWERWPVARVVIERMDKAGNLRPSEELAADLKVEVLDKLWPHARGGALKPEMALHDSGDRPALVFDVLSHLPSTRNIATKGIEGWGAQQPAASPKIGDVRQNGKVVATGRRSMKINTAQNKKDFFEDLRRAPAEHSLRTERFVHLPAWLDQEEWLDGLVAEEIKKVRGKPRWVPVTENIRNEPLDCAILALCAYWQLKGHRWSAKEWARREALVASERPPQKPTPDGAPSGTRRGRAIGRM